MLRNILSYCLCFILAFPHSVHAEVVEKININQLDEQAILKQYPNARIIRTTPEDYPQIAEQLRSQGYNQLALNQHTPEETRNNQTKAKKTDDCGSSNTPTDDRSLNLALDISGDVLDGSTRGGDAAALFFIVVGTVLIVVWTLYVFKYLYDFTTGFRPCGYWTELTLTSSSISGNFDEDADFNGISFMTGFRDANTEVGIGIELGEADILLPELLDERLEGTYWFLGPVVRWRMSPGNNPHYLNMKFLAGSTEHDEIDTLAKANVGIQFGLGESTHIGLNMGAMYIDIEQSKGILQDSSDFYYMYGMNFGFKF